MTRLRCLLALALFLFLAIPLSTDAGGQLPGTPTARDTAYVLTTRPALDSLAMNLARYCETKSAPGYVKAICPIAPRLSAGLDALLVAPVVVVPPQPVPTPTPTPTPTPAPIPSGDSAGVIELPELPRVHLDTRVAATPSPGPTIAIARGGNVQAALDTARAGSTITVECGATFGANLTIRPKAGASTTSWITVRSTCAVPAEGVRIAPSQAFARIAAPNLMPALTTQGAAAFYRFVGIEFTVDPSVTYHQGLVLLGGEDAAETTVAALPHDIILDRSYVHMTPTGEVRRCVTLNGPRMAVVESYISECHAAAYDVQAIASWKGSALKIENTHLEASTEIIALGGSDPGIADYSITDVEILRNHLTRPLAWQGGGWNIKNLIEIKNGNRVRIDGNVLENSWPNGQAGEAFVLWSINAQFTAPQSETANLTITNNVIRNVGRAFNLAAQGYWTKAQIPMHHVLIRNNVVIGLTAPGGDGRIFAISDTIQHLVIDHNTAFTPGSSSFIWGTDLSQHAIHLRGHVVTNNLTGGGQFQIFTSYGIGKIAWDSSSGPGSAFRSNVVVGYPGWYQPIPGNWFPGAFDDVGLAGGGAVATSVTATLDQLALSATSPYKGKATDGSDVGANIAAVKAATAGVVQP